SVILERITFEALSYYFRLLYDVKRRELFKKYFLIMAQDNLVYPVGMYYLASGNGTASSSREAQESDETKIVGFPDTADKDEDDNETNTEEDRSSEDYWEKRKRFTLAFAAGLRKFIQMHPELLRYGPKKNQGAGISATVTSSVVVGDDGGLADGETAQCGRCVACLKTDDCGKCAFCTDMSKFGGKNELKKLCIRRQCLHAPIKNAVGAGTNSSSVANDTHDGSTVRPVRVKAGINNDSDFLFPVKEEYLDDEDEEVLQRSVKQTRISSPRAKRSRKTTRRSRNDDDVDYKPSQRSRRLKSQNLEEAAKIVNIKTEIVDTPE
uniref:CXXC-type domain-containing protein n=1 Tax=Strigamia maritima TaxID=126957 RepID=T1J8E3_STRMM